MTKIQCKEYIEELIEQYPMFNIDINKFLLCASDEDLIYINKVISKCALLILDLDGVGGEKTTKLETNLLYRLSSKYSK